MSEIAQSLAESQPPVLSKKEEEKQAIARVADLELCKQDRFWKFEKHFYIKDVSGKIRPLTKLKLAQIRIIKLIDHIRNDLKWPVRILILKARKEGLSTAIEMDLYDQTDQKQLDAIVLAHDQGTAEYIMDITKRFHNFLDLPKTELSRESKYELRFKEPHDGKIFVQTAGDIQAGTGMTPQYCHSSETAKWQKGSQTAVSLLQAMADEPGTTLIHESTAFGYDELFYPMWQVAEETCKLTFDGENNPTVEVTKPEEWNGYVPFFVPWFDDPTYKRSFTSLEEKERFSAQLDDYEKSLIERFGLSLEQLFWRRFTIRHKCQGDTRFFRQEYPATSLEAFLASGRPRLDHEALAAMPIEEGRKVRLEKSTTWSKNIQPVPDSASLLTVFRNPKVNHRYVIGLDVHEGTAGDDIEKTDQSAAIVLDLDAGLEQVATYSGYAPEEYVVEPLILLSEWYNFAYVVIETNSTGKHVAIEMAKVYPPDRLYHRMTYDSDSKKRTRAIGWKTHVGSRNILVGKLASAVHELAVIIHDKNTLFECQRFVYSKTGKVQADSGYRDDHCFALGMAIIGAEDYPETQLPLTPAARRSAQERLRGRTRSQRSRDSITGY